MHFYCSMSTYVCSMMLELDFLLWQKCGVGFLCVGGPHMASDGRGSNDGKGRMKEREKMIQKKGKFNKFKLKKSE